MAKKSRFTVYVTVTVETELDIRAETFEEALEIAKGYEVKEVVDFNTPHNDSSIKVRGVTQ